jgi:hypothetical protein
MIIIGSIVRLHNNLYKVREVQEVNGKVYPRAVQSINVKGQITGPYVHKDSTGEWAKHSWELLSNFTPEDPKTKIIAKIKYLDEKFKKSQENKKQLVVKEELNQVHDSYYEPVQWTSTPGTLINYLRGSGNYDSLPSM